MADYLLLPQVLSRGSSCSRSAPEVCFSRPCPALERTARPPPPPAPIPPIFQPSPSVHLHFFASSSLVAGCASVRRRPHLGRDGAKPDRTVLLPPSSALEARSNADVHTYIFFSLRRSGRGAIVLRRRHRGAAFGCARTAPAHVPCRGCFRPPQRPIRPYACVRRPCLLYCRFLARLRALPAQFARRTAVLPPLAPVYAGARRGHLHLVLTRFRSVEAVLRLQYRPPVWGGR